jgi:hypothetical protein
MMRVLHFLAGPHSQCQPCDSRPLVGTTTTHGLQVSGMRAAIAGTAHGCEVEWTTLYRGCRWCVVKYAGAD